MKIHNCEFIGSYASVERIPKSDLLEVCFWGRSNVGKSSLISYICNRNDLAKTSSHPGKTQTLNLFLLNETINLMDLPGYSYAKVSKNLKERWLPMITDYIINRENLYLCYLLIDGSIPIQKIDQEMMVLLNQNRIPFNIVFTKTDKVKQRERAVLLKDFKYHLKDTWEVLPEMIETSATDRIGADLLLNQISQFTTN